MFHINRCCLLYKSNQYALGQIVIYSRPLIHNMHRKLASKLNKKKCSFFTLAGVNEKRCIFVHQMYFYYGSFVDDALSLPVYLYIYFLHTTNGLSLSYYFFIELLELLELTRNCQMHTNTNTL